MEIISPNSEINSAINKLIREELVDFTCQFFKLHNDFMVPFGSGVFAFLGGSHYILTASHIAEYLDGRIEKAELFVRGNDGFVTVRGAVKGIDISKDTRVDLAYIKLQESFHFHVNKHYKFLPISKFRSHNKLIQAAQYCVLGFPERNLWPKNDIIISGANAYLLEPCKEKVYRQYNFNFNDSYLLEMKGKGIDLVNGNKTKVKSEFHGISGCGLWLLIINKFNESYNIDFRLIGIVTEYKKGKYFCLIANKIGILLDAISGFENYTFLSKIAN